MFGINNNLNENKNKHMCVTIQNNTIIYYARDLIIINPHTEIRKNSMMINMI